MKQKLMIPFMLIMLLLLGSCKANFPVAQQSGKDDVAYLLFVSASNSSETVDVTIDGNVSFEAKTVKAKKANRKGTSYGIATGRRKIKVTKEGEVLYNKEIFVSTQETKIITLP